MRVTGKRKRKRSIYERQAALWIVRGRDTLDNKRHEKAVKDAISRIGDDIDLPELREALKNGILLNCEDGKRYCYRYLNLSCFSERDFYRRKERFLEDVYNAM